MSFKGFGKDNNQEESDGKILFPFISILITLALFSIMYAKVVLTKVFLIVNIIFR